MNKHVLLALFIFFISPLAVGSEIIIEGAFEQGIHPLPTGPDHFTLKIYGKDIPGFVGLDVLPFFVDAAGVKSTSFAITQQGGNQAFGGYCIYQNTDLFPNLEEAHGSTSSAFFSVTSGNKRDISNEALLLEITFEYTSAASGPYLVDLTGVLTRRLGTDSVRKSCAFTIRMGHLSVGNSLRYWYVDDVGENGDGSSNSPFNTIQNGIDAASNGDVVLVRDGYYTGPGNRNIDFSGKAIIVASENGADNCTIDAQGTFAYGQQHRSFYFHSDEGRCSVLKGFTLTGGVGPEAEIMLGMETMLGGAILCKGSEVTRHGPTPSIIDNLIVGNYAVIGGGICVSYASPLLQGNQFAANTAVDGGGAIAAIPGKTSVMVVTNNSIVNNTARGYDGGGAVFLVEDFSAGYALISDNEFLGNVAPYGGAFLLAYAYKTAVIRNFVAFNGAYRTYRTIGGAFSLFYTEDCAIAGNVVCFNEAFNGAAFAVTYESRPLIVHNTIAFNRARHGASGIYSSFSLPFISHCILWNSGTEIEKEGHMSSPQYSCIQGLSEPNPDHNISSYPHFVDPVFSSFKLKEYSPCIDAGAIAPLPLQADFDGNYRPLLTAQDIGAYEAHEKSTEDTDDDGLPDAWELEYLGSTEYGRDDDPDGDDIKNYLEFQMGSHPLVALSEVYVDDDASGYQDGSLDNPFDSIQKGVAFGTERVYVAEGEYVEEVVVENKAISILGGFYSDFTLRDPVNHASVIDSSGVASIVTGRPVTYYDCDHGAVGALSGEISGFTITGGNTMRGGGIYCERSSPKIANNTIAGNLARDGGGIACVDSSPEITGNTIGTLQAPNIASRNGGGLYCTCPGLTSSKLVVRDNKIAGNSSMLYGGGAYFYKIQFAGRTGMLRNDIMHNSSTVGGGAFLELIDDLAAKNNLIAGNTAIAGAGLVTSWCRYLLLKNNTISSNAAD